MTTAYDDLAYPTTAFRQTHPDRLATHAALLGLPFAPPGACRVLDIGGGDGMNVIGMALTHPGTEFVSFDLSQAAVRRGQEAVEALGLSNVRVIAADLMDLDLGEAPFDYIIAHGFYSWVPEPVREAMMALIRRRMAPNGVAFVSYNAQPGGRIRQIVRDLLLLHLKDVADPAERMAEARRKLQQVVDDYPQGDEFQAALKARCKALLETPPEVMAHDDIGEVFHPVYLREFLAHAGAHGLQFLTEADPAVWGEGALPSDAADEAGFDVIAHAQEQDFRSMRGFRQTLLVHAEAQIDRRVDPSRLEGLYVSSPAVPVGEDEFETRKRRFKLMDRGLIEAMTRLADAWPLALPVADLRLDEERLAALLRMYAAELVSLHAEPSPFTAAAGERPAASPLARWQLARGEKRLITLSHTVFELDDAAGRAFVAALDGTRTRDELAARMAEVSGAPLATVAEQLPGKLETLARMPLLVR